MQVPSSKVDLLDKDCQPRIRKHFQLRADIKGIAKNLKSAGQDGKCKGNI